MSWTRNFPHFTPNLILGKLCTKSGFDHIVERTIAVIQKLWGAAKFRLPNHQILVSGTILNDISDPVSESVHKSSLNYC